VDLFLCWQTKLFGAAKMVKAFFEVVFYLLFVCTCVFFFARTCMMVMNNEEPYPEEQYFIEGRF